MSRRFLPLALLLLSLVGSGLLTGCGPRPPQADNAPLVVVVSRPIQREVMDVEEFTGRLDAVNSVDVRPRVTGYLMKMPFTEGAEVKKDALLFEIDERPYKAQFDRAQADVYLQEAKLKLAKADNIRAKKIRADNAAAISQQDLDKYQAAEEVEDAAVKAAKANVEVYKLNLDWCKVLSPINGQVSRYFLTVGNLANQDTAILTTIVSLDPIYAYFDMDERTLLRIKNRIIEGKVSYRPGTSDIDVYLGLAGETGFPHQGTVNFVNNKVDAQTGTITVRGSLANPRKLKKDGQVVADKDKGAYLMTPGMFCRVRVPTSRPYKALLVAERAFVIDQGLKNIFVLDGEDKVQYRQVTLGALQPDGTRVVLDGVKEDDRILITGLQQVRAGMKVEVEEKPMPTVPVLTPPVKFGTQADVKPAKPEAK